MHPTLPPLLSALLCATALAQPTWFDELPPERRPALPLPDGLTPCEDAGDYLYTLPDGSELALVFVPPGTYRRGDPTATGPADERPVAEVTVEHGFFLGTYELTWELYLGYRAAHGDETPPTSSEGFQANGPVTGLSWEEARAFCEWAGLRLPSEAEWEYACRAGTTTHYSFGDDPAQLPAYAWFRENDADRPRVQPVGQKRPNAWGLHDMHGNVWEWCQDLYHFNYLGAPTDGSARTGSGDRVLRGGSTYSVAEGCRAALRNPTEPSSRSSDVGVRPALSHPAASGRRTPPSHTSPPPPEPQLHTAPLPLPERVTPGEADGAYVLELPDASTLHVRYVPPGTFRRGDLAGVGDPDEYPVQDVTIPRGLFVGTYEVTCAEYRRFCQATGHPLPELAEDDARPVDVPVGGVTWDDARAFCDWAGVRLLSEDEWEYVCRAGTTTRYNFGDDLALLDDHAWYGANAAEVTHPVGRKRPNAWGLYDLHGNAWEWCQDRYTRAYGGRPDDVLRVIRGGSAFTLARECRSSERFGLNARLSGAYLGFRVALSVPTRPALLLDELSPNPRGLLSLEATRRREASLPLAPLAPLAAKSTGSRPGSRLRRAPTRRPQDAPRARPAAGRRP